MYKEDLPILYISLLNIFITKKKSLRVQEKGQGTQSYVIARPCFILPPNPKEKEKEKINSGKIIIITS